MPPLHNSKGYPTGAIYGVLNMVMSTIKLLKPDYMVVVFDSKGKTFREEIFSDYKANREAMPDDLQKQFEPLLTGLKGMGIPVIMQSGVEADDIIGTIVRNKYEIDLDIVISTMDKDMAQLVTDSITLLNTMKNTSMNIEGVKRKFGVYPYQIIDYLALMGDVSDNIPGIPGVGPKTAVKWLNQYETLDNLLKNAHLVKGKVGESLRNNISLLQLSRTLVTIKDDLDLGIKIDDLLINREDPEVLDKLFRNLEFKKWLDDFSEEPKPRKESIICKMINTKANFQEWIDNNTTNDILSIYIYGVFTSENQYMMHGIAMANRHKAVYIPISHNIVDDFKQLEIDYVMESIIKLIRDKELILVCHDLKNTIKILKLYGFKAEHRIHDIMLMGYLLNSALTNLNIPSLANKFLDMPVAKVEDIISKNKINEVAISSTISVIAENIFAMIHIYDRCYNIIKKHHRLTYLYNNLDLPITYILLKMEVDGVLLDSDILQKQSLLINEKMLKIQEESFKITNETFNFNSPKQLQEILYDKLKLPVIKKTPKGQASTAEPVLQELAHDYPLPKYILDFRRLSKLKSTYTDALPKLVDPVTNRIHTSFNQAVTTTGRLSSSNPNLQNIPIRFQEGKAVRKAFIAPSGHKIVSVDYSQVELRLMAHFSEDTTLINAFKKGLDIHESTAAEIFDHDINSIDTDMRRKAKIINFGLLYGMSAFGLSRQLSITRADATKYINNYFSKYPGIISYMKNVKNYAAENGFVETYHGRRIFLPDIKSSNAIIRKSSERAAINGPLQGTSADIIKLAMISVDKYINKYKHANMIIQVHDELVFEVKDEYISKFCEEIKDIMCNVVKLLVPLEVNISLGDNWSQCK